MPPSFSSFAYTKESHTRTSLRWQSSSSQEEYSTRIQRGLVIIITGVQAWEMWEMNSCCSYHPVCLICAMTSMNNGRQITGEETEPVCHTWYYEVVGIPHRNSRSFQVTCRLSEGHRCSVSFCRSVWAQEMLNVFSYVTSIMVSDDLWVRNPRLDQAHLNPNLVIS